jgi:hypothetical protein
MTGLTLRGRTLVVGAFVVAILFLAPGLTAGLPTRATRAPTEGLIAGSAEPNPSVQELLSPTPYSPSDLIWSIASIFYGNGVGDGYYFGEGGPIVVNNPTSNVTFFGGEGQSGLTNLTTNYNTSDGEFNPIVYTPSPSPRTNASFADYAPGGFAVLYGGLTNLSSQQVSNETWVYYFLNQTWRNVSQPFAPPARESAAFAVNASGGTALLQGGLVPRTEVGGGTASVLWNDTWSLNLTTFNWTPIASPNAPAPAYGASMIWQNVTNEYLLFGGCALVCSSETWSFSNATVGWQQVPVGAPPAPRGGAIFVWDNLDQVGLLYGGFVPAGNHLDGIADGEYFEPTTDRWIGLNPQPNPTGPRYDVPSAWADFPGCEGLIVVGGNTTLLGPPPNATFLQPANASLGNCVNNPGNGTGVGGPPPPNCSVLNVSLSIRVIDNTTFLGVPNATVEVQGEGHCITTQVETGPDGYANVTLAGPFTYNLTATHPGYHSDKAYPHIEPNQTNAVVIPLAPYPALHVRTWGLNNSSTPAILAGVAVNQGASYLIGSSDAEGWMNVSAWNYTGNGSLELVGVKSGWSAPHKEVQLPYTGVFTTNLTLLAAAELEIRVVNATDGDPLGAANGTLQDRDPGAPFPVPFITDLDGWANMSAVPSANYTVHAQAPGYLPNATTFFLPWVYPKNVTVALRPELGATMDVFVRDTSTGLPIDEANVTLVGRAYARTDPGGWANFTDVVPVGSVDVRGDAPGFIENSSWVAITYYQVLSRFVLNLTPLPACAASDGCFGHGPGGVQTTPFGLPFGAGLAGALLFAAPVFFVVLGLLYLFAIRRRTPVTPLDRRLREPGVPP